MQFGAIHAGREEDCLEMLASWDYSPGQRVLILGAGSLGLSVSLARRLSQCVVIHLDTSRFAPAPTRSPESAVGPPNFELLSMTMDSGNFLPGTMRVIILECSATVPDPEDAARSLFQWLSPDGLLVVEDSDQRHTGDPLPERDEPRGILRAFLWRAAGASRHRVSHVLSQVGFVVESREEHPCRGATVWRKPRR
jgi:hypothetical protein